MRGSRLGISERDDSGLPGGLTGYLTGMEDDTQTDIEKEKEEARQEVEQLEDDPPAKLEEWPEGKAKYETFGGPEGEHSYDEGPEKNLGPDSLRHHEDGAVTVSGEEADDPDE